MAASRGAVARAPVSTVTSEGMPLATHALVNNTWQGNSLGPLSEKPALPLIHHSQKAVLDLLGVCVAAQEQETWSHSDAPWKGFHMGSQPIMAASLLNMCGGNYANYTGV